MATNQLLPFGTGGGANVLAYTDYNALAARLSGFSAGTAVSQQLNTVWRQGSFAAAMIGQFTVDYSGQDVLDNGNVTTFENSFVNALQRIGKNGVTSYTTAGTYTFTVPANVYVVKVRLWGGGGGGGGITSNAASGGGGGGYWEGYISVAPGATLTIVVGAGGTGGANTGGNGGNGGVSSIAGTNITITCNGGGGGTGATSSMPGTFGAGGTVSSSGSSVLQTSLALTGQAGGVGYFFNPNYGGGQGGGSYSSARPVIQLASAGSAGVSPAGGGNGAAGGAGALPGGAGAPGQAILEY